MLEAEVEENVVENSKLPLQDKILFFEQQQQQQQQRYEQDLATQTLASIQMGETTTTTQR